MNQGLGRRVWLARLKSWATGGRDWLAGHETGFKEKTLRGRQEDNISF